MSSPIVSGTMHIEPPYGSTLKESEHTLETHVIMSSVNVYKDVALLYSNKGIAEIFSLVLATISKLHL